MNRLKKSILILITGLFVMATSCTRDEEPMPEDVNAISAQLTTLMERASSGPNDSNAIDCIDFLYPITLFVYDSNQEQTDTVTINNDGELFTFLTQLDPNFSVSISYPIQVVLNDGTVVEVSDNEQLGTLISDCESNGQNEVPADFVQYLTDGVWYVTYYFDDTDETSDFAGYAFEFASDSTATATKNGVVTNGTWGLTGSSFPDLELFFGNEDPLDELDEDWDIINATNEIIELKDISGDSTIDYVTFERNPNGGGTGNSDFVAALTDGSWYVNLLEDDGNDETCDYAEYEFVFASNETVTASSANNTVNGTWSTTGNGSTLDLVLNFDTTGENDPFDDLNDDWDVTNFTTELIELLDISGGNGGTDYLNFGRNPADCGGTDNGGFVNTLTDGSWYVNLLEDDGEDETCDYVAYEFVFASNQTVTATSDNNTVNGTWSATGSGASLDLNLNFDTTGEDDPFDDLNDDWDVSNFTTELIELIDISGGNGGTDYLNFGRNPADCGGTGTGDVQELMDILVDGMWYVETYLDDGNNETNDYTNYTFDFNTDGTVAIDANGTSESGTWSVGFDDNVLKVTLNLGPTSPLEELNDDWNVDNYITTRVELFDISGGNGGTDTLVFEKL
ncbi:hypothetical protein MG296_00940 [Flavobacteriaceae bacterium TK19130]|nr:hypothetical protein [Thermobacterium salinum]